jgi:hypothetical protein
MKHGTTIRLVRRGERHPYVIEVTTPGWRGCDHAYDGTVSQTMPADLREIRKILIKANVKYFSPSDPRKSGVMLLMADGATEFVLADASDFESAVVALTRSGWLSPEGRITVPAAYVKRVS